MSELPTIVVNYGPCLACGKETLAQHPLPKTDRWRAYAHQDCVRRAAGDGHAEHDRIETVKLLHGDPDAPEPQGVLEYETLDVITEVITVSNMPQSWLEGTAFASCDISSPPLDPLDDIKSDLLVDSQGQ
jgi:hypothetical protein